jgi:hypothetical protein
MVDMMLADGEITPMRLRGKLVRFYLPDVLQELREKAKTSKRGCCEKGDNAAMGWLPHHGRGESMVMVAFPGWGERVLGVYETRFYVVVG